MMQFVGMAACLRVMITTTKDQGWLRRIVAVTAPLGAVLVLSFVLGDGVARANDIYIAQSAAGSNNGSSCANAQAYGFFNTAANWGSGGNQIGPGTTVHLCGTITCPTNGTLLTAHGSGASSNPVTILFDAASGGNLTSPACGVFMALDGQSHFIVDGGATCGWINGSDTPCAGRIQNTANGTTLANHNYGAEGISIQQSNDVEVRNLHIGPMYLKAGAGDQLSGAPGPVCVRFTDANTISGVNIHNNILHDAGWCLWGGANNLTIANNDIYNIDHGLGFGSNTDGTSSYSTISIHDNHVHDTGNWDTTSNDFHHDGFHLFAYAADGYDFNPNNSIGGINIYNNRFDGSWGSNNTANIFFEGNIGNASIFNNVTVVGGQLNNGQYNGYGSNIRFYNNTAIGPGPATQTQKFSIFTGPGFVIKNNIWTDGGTISTNGPFPNDCPGYTACQSVSYTLATNAYFASADFSNGFGYTNCSGASCTGNGFLNFNASGFASFEAGAPETGGVFRELVTSTILNTSTGAQLSASPTLGAGTNLSLLCTKNGGSMPDALCSDIAGNPRPTTGSWDIGAYQGISGQSTLAPTVPTGLTAVVH